MKIGMVISGGDVSGINNFIFQIARLASADITFLMAEYPGCWIKIIRKSPGAIWLISPLLYADHYLRANQPQIAAQ
jgi:hypothetical protein